LTALVDIIYRIMATTQRGRHVFKVAEHAGDHTPWIMTEPVDARDRLPVLRDGGFFGFDLTPGTTFEQAKIVAQYLNDHLDGISCTLFEE
jgi:hypothetical protein